MATITFDTFRAVKRLEENGYSSQQAQGFVEAVQEIDMSEFASRADIEVVRTDIKSSENRLIMWVVALNLTTVGLSLSLLSILQ